MRTCIILRGLPGSGKSSLALDLFHLGAGKAHSADDYFVDSYGTYNFDIGKIGEAHEWCFDNFKISVQCEEPVIVVDNTNCKVSEFSHYKEYAEKHGYTVFVVLVENHHGNKSVHDVPERTLERREKLLRDSIKLR